jgi:putative ABC transport system permease protein
MGAIWQDVRYGARVLVKRKGFMLVAVAALALGVGANTAIFSVVNAVLLRPLPFAESDRLVKIYVTDARRGITKYPTSYLNFADWRAQSSSFEAVAAHASTGASVRAGEVPESVEGVYVSADLFRVLKAAPAMGRTFLPEEESAGSRVVVISHEMWRKRFNSDPAIVNRQVLFDGDPVTVVGVMPEGFRFPVEVVGPEYWQPLNPKSETNLERGQNYLSVVGRLKPGVTVEQAQAEMETVAARLEQQHAEKNAGRGVNLVPLHEDIVGDVRPALLMLLGAVGFVLLIACANVANLTLARAASRSREIAVRSALGASRWRVARQLLTESLLLSLAGGLAGLLLAVWGVEALAAAVPADIPRAAEIGIDPAVLLFTLGVAVLSGVVFGLAPALRASKSDFNEALREGSRGSIEGFRGNRLRGLLVVSEVALSLVLLVGAGLMIRSFYELRAVRPGFDPQNLLTAGIGLPPNKYPDEASQAAFFKQVLERVAALPGVKSVGGVEPLPMSGNNWSTTVTVDGVPAPPPGQRQRTQTRVVSPGYHRAMGIPLLRGRFLTEQDTAQSPKAVVVSESFARQVFPGESAVGRRITPTLAPNFTAEIVGVVGDVKHRALDETPAPELYASYQQAPQPFLALVVRAEPAVTAGLTNSVREAVLQIDPNQPLYNVKTMEELLSDSVARRRFNMTLLGVFAAIALALAAVGVFGVMSYSVTRRTHEIGIRVALGAQRRDVLRLVVGQGMALVGAGVALGLACALALSRLIAGLLYGVSASDPVIYAGVALLLSAVALLACYLPARRATKVDPMVALRYE